MEKQLTALSSLTKYKDRQVVINLYSNDGFLEKREGFHFEGICLSKTEISFIKKNKETFSIPLLPYPSVFAADDFPNYFILKNKDRKIELYFP